MLWRWMSKLPLKVFLEYGNSNRVIYGIYALDVIYYQLMWCTYYEKYEILKKCIVYVI